MNQRGFAPLYLIGVLLIGLAGILIYSRQASITKPPEDSNNQSQATPSASATFSSSPTTKANTSLLPAKSSTPKPSPTSSRGPTPTPTATPTQVSAAKKNTCGVNVIYGKLGGVSSDPLLVTMIYSFSSYNNTYMTGAQWDFNGDGNWDTDMKQSNGTMEHTYGSGGNYNVKLRVQGSDGVTTDVCSKTITVKPAVNIILNGQVYTDINCNNSKEAQEEGKAGMIIDIMEPTGLVHGTVTSDGSGNYSYSETIAEDKTVSLIPSARDHNRQFEPPTTAFNKDNRNATINLASCP